MGVSKFDICETLIIDLFRKTIDILEKNNVEYWLYFGSLLGFVREGKFIKNDSDIDIVVKDLNDVKILEKELNKKNLIFRENDQIVDVDNDLFHIGFWEMKKYDNKMIIEMVKNKNLISRSANVMIFLLKGDTHKLGKISISTMQRFIFLSNLPFSKKFITILKKIEYLSAHKVWFMFDSFDYETVKMHNTSVKIPKNCKKHLKMIYGNNWRIPDRTFSSHGEEFSKYKNRIFFINFDRCNI